MFTLLSLAACVAEGERPATEDPDDPNANDESPVDFSIEPTDVPVSPAALATGTKRVLVIRVEFQDLFSTQSASDAQAIMDNEVRPRYQTSSYGRVDLASTVTAKVYRLPHPASYYATYPGDVGARDVIHNDAEHAASADYTLANFDRLVVTFPNLGRVPGSHVKYSGWAQGSRVWINGSVKFGVLAHELGHTMGLYHSNTWEVTDGNVVSPSGKSVGYADGFDLMGVNYQISDPRADFNPRFKVLMGWIDPVRIRNVTASGKYRVFRFDDPQATTGTMALTIHKDATRTYWICLRRAFTDNAIASNGAYIVWGYVNTGNWQDDHKTDLIDMDPTTYAMTSGFKDAMLPIGRSLADDVAGVTITPVGNGGTAPHEYLDVQITFH